MLLNEIPYGEKEDNIFTIVLTMLLNEIPYGEKEDNIYHCLNYLTT